MERINKYKQEQQLNGGGGGVMKNGSQNVSEGAVTSTTGASMHSRGRSQDKGGATSSISLEERRKMEKYKKNLEKIKQN